MAQPDFIIIGAMKCGTSTLAAQLGAQDGIFLTTPKEPNYFSDDAVFAKGAQWYADLFQDAPVGALKGEASTHYTKLPTYPDTVARMTKVLKAPRLVYMVRDPVQRAVSHYIHEWTERRMRGTLSAALETYTDLVQYGLYAKQLAPFIDAFGIDAICLTSLERLKASPVQELERVARHVGFDGQMIWKDDLATQNVSGERIRKLPLHNVLINNPVAQILRRKLVPQNVRARIARSRQMDARPTLNDQQTAQLRATFSTDQETLRDLFPGVL